MNVRFLSPFFLAFCLSAFAGSAPPLSRAGVRRTVDAAVQPLMKQYAIPGAAVGILIGPGSYVFDYGMASLDPPRPVTPRTLFELGSVSKTFTATLVSYARVTGHLSLADTTSQYLPSLLGTNFGRVTLLELGTHTPGGLPLQVPHSIHTDAQLLRYFRSWRPTCPPGTCRTYSNIGIGTLGLIAAKSMNGSFSSLMRRDIFRPLRLRNTYLEVPGSEFPDYAQGYTSSGRPVRLAPGELSMEAYGIRTTATDMLRFLTANTGELRLSPQLRSAILATHTGYFRAGPITQDLIWEQFPWPVTLPSLLRGNSPAMILDATPVTAIRPPRKPIDAVWLNKTGSTNGFAAYVAFVPSLRLGIVILANKDFPIDARVTAAYRILASLSAAAQ